MNAFLEKYSLVVYLQILMKVTEKKSINRIMWNDMLLLFVDEITSSFRRFGPLVVDWPHKAESKSYFPPKGYAFLLFQVCGL